MRKFKTLGVLIALTGAGCGGTSVGNPSLGSPGASTAAASSVGGGMSSSGANGALGFALRENFFESAVSVPKAYAFSSCPNYHSAQGSGCAQSGSTLWITDSSCHPDAGSSEVWTGVLAYIASSGTAMCGTFPAPAGGTLDLQWQAVSGGATPAFGTIADSPPVPTKIIDDATANLANFQGDAISTIINGGYGISATYNGSGARTSITIAHHYYSPTMAGFDSSITGTLTVNESGGASSRTIDGTITVYHNAINLIGTTTFHGVTHSDTCCFPISGEITTSYAASTNPALPPKGTGITAAGVSEVLTLTGCGTGSLSVGGGAAQDVTLNECF